MTRSNSPIYKFFECIITDEEIKEDLNLYYNGRSRSPHKKLRYFSIQSF